jgi:hypothetical protein
MPRTPSRLARIVLTTALALAALPAAGASAATGCPPVPSTPAFAPFGDPAGYTLAPGGSFENSLRWLATGQPTLVEGNEPFMLSGHGSRSVRLRGRDAIVSPPICVDALRPTMRFVTRALDAESRLVLEVLWYDAGAIRRKVLEEHPADGWREWAPSKVVPLGAALPTDEGEVHQVLLRFSLKDGAGEWLVDDVFIDPYRR